MTLKLAVSIDGMIGRAGSGQIAITGAISRAQSHVMRAETDAILVGVGTVEADDPELTCRLPGLEDRSPTRIVIDPQARLSMRSKLAQSARSAPVLVAASAQAPAVRRSSLEMLGLKFVATEEIAGRIALPELLEDLGGMGISTLLVEGGAATARAFLEDDLVDRIALFVGAYPIGDDGVRSPVLRERMPERFVLRREAQYGLDRFSEWVRG